MYFLVICLSDLDRHFIHSEFHAAHARRLKRRGCTLEQVSKTNCEFFPSPIAFVVIKLTLRYPSTFFVRSFFNLHFLAKCPFFPLTKLAMSPLVFSCRNSFLCFIGGKLSLCCHGDFRFYTDSATCKVSSTFDTFKVEAVSLLCLIITIPTASYCSSEEVNMILALFSHVGCDGGLQRSILVLNLTDVFLAKRISICRTISLVSPI